MNILYERNVRGSPKEYCSTNQENLGKIRSEIDITGVRLISELMLIILRDSNFKENGHLMHT